ncbi:hypothetical protein AC1031_018864 [Aphanomyces cochlioides]|nr:hypothetical protein AC1031_018864 [Aphanomyces cochlioides]
MEDSLRLVHSILDEDRSFLDFLKDEKRTERERLHRQLSQSTHVHPETIINDTCHNLMDELELVESELSFYESLQHEPDPTHPISMREAPRRSLTQPKTSTSSNDISAPIVTSKMTQQRHREDTVRPATQVDPPWARLPAALPKKPSSSKLLDQSTMPKSLTLGQTRRRCAESSAQDRRETAPTDSKIAFTRATAPSDPLKQTPAPLEYAASTSGKMPEDDDRHAHIPTHPTQRLSMSSLDQEPLDRSNGQREIAEALAAVEETCKAQQQKELNDVLMQNELRLEREKRHIVDKYAMETQVKKGALERQLELDRVCAIREMEEKFASDLQGLEERMKQAVADELDHRRDRMAMTLLQRQEEILQHQRKAVMETHEVKEREEMAKLEQALQSGATLRIQQLRDRLASQRQAKLNEMERAAQVSLERELELLRCQHDADMLTQVHETQDRLRQQHEAQVDSLRKALAVDETKSLNDVTEQLRQNHMKRIQRIRDEHEAQRHERLVQLQQTYEAEYLQRMDALHSKLDSNLENELASLVDELKKANQKALDDRTTFFAEIGNRLKTELHYMLTMPKPKRIKQNERKADDDSAESYESEALTQLQSLRVTSRQVNQWIHALTQEFVDLSEQNAVLLESVGKMQAQLGSWKQKCLVETELNDQQRAKLDVLQREMREKDQLCRRLYLANEELLKQRPPP